MSVLDLAIRILRLLALISRGKAGRRDLLPACQRLILRSTVSPSSRSSLEVPFPDDFLPPVSVVQIASFFHVVDTS